MTDINHNPIIPRVGTAAALATADFITNEIAWTSDERRMFVEQGGSMVTVDWYACALANAAQATASAASLSASIAIINSFLSLTTNRYRNISTKFYEWSGTVWVEINAGAAARWVSFSAGAAVVFTGYGTYYWDGSSWHQIHASDAEAVVVAAGVLYADFGASGILQYSGSGTSWAQIATDNPSDLYSLDGSLYAVVSAALYRYTGTGMIWEAVGADPPVYRGGIPYRGPTEWGMAPLGTPGQVMTVNAGGTAPEYATPAGVSDGDKGDVTVSGSGASWKLNFQNLGIAASVGSKALTVAMKVADGNDPSATNPIRILFRDETLTVGTPNVRSVTGALSIVLPSGGTLGFTAALPGRIYIWAIDNAGTVELALSRTADLFSEDSLVSTTAIGSGSDSATIMYSTTARSNVACRCLGYIDITTGATAGEWSNAPTKIQLMGPGVKRTGDIVQSPPPYCPGSYATGSTVIPLDDTIPQNTEGDEYMSLAITPKSAINKLKIDVVFVCSLAGLRRISVALFQDTTAGALAGVIDHIGQNDYSSTIAFSHWMTAGTISATTFKVRAGAADSLAMYFNGTAAARVFGGVAVSSIKITEVMA
jgi:hypothetical protein